jgi:hypothetical protein
MNGNTDDGVLELDLNRAAPAIDVIDLDIGGSHQLGVVEQFGLMSTGVVSVPADAELPTREEFAVAKLAQELGYTEILTVGALEDGIRFYKQRAAEACLELGKRLLLLKEVAGHGEFSKRVELLGVSPETARRFMRITRKYSKTVTLTVLAGKIDVQQKLLDLLVMDDDDLQEIADGGDVAGLNADDIAFMSPKELRAALRKYKDGNLPEEKAKPLNDRIAALEKQIGNHEKHNGQIAAELELRNRELKQLTQRKRPGQDAYSIETMAIREEAYALQYGASTYIAALKKVLNRAMEPALVPEETELRQGAVGVAISALMFDLDGLYKVAQFAIGEESMPPELSGKHVLSELEKERLADCRIIIDHDFALKESARETRRAEESRKSAGRPFGSKNKPD